LPAGSPPCHGVGRGLNNRRNDENAPGSFPGRCYFRQVRGNRRQRYPRPILTPPPTPTSATQPDEPPGRPSAPRVSTMYPRLTGPPTAATPPATYAPHPCRRSGLRRKCPRASARQAKAPSEAPPPTEAEKRVRPVVRSATKGPTTTNAGSDDVTIPWIPISPICCVFPGVALRAAPAATSSSVQGKCIRDSYIGGE
jgi:hypothetical protein